VKQRDTLCPGILSGRWGFARTDVSRLLILAGRFYAGTVWDTVPHSEVA
jgi:hypothetical protein